MMWRDAPDLTVESPVVMAHPTNQPRPNVALWSLVPVDRRDLLYNHKIQYYKGKDGLPELEDV